jgi:putative ABC transport system permease protein
MLGDIRYALLQLRKTPSFSLLAVVTLTVGIGLNTAIFSLVNNLFLRRLPFSAPEQIVHMYSESKERDLKDFPLSATRFLSYRDGQTIFSALAAESQTLRTLTGLGDPVQLAVGPVTPNYFDVLGIRPIKGRNFLPQEEETTDVALVTENFWRNRLGGDPDVLGRSIILDDVQHSIVGVLPNVPVAWFGPDVEVWTTKPFVIPGFSRERTMRGTTFLRVIGRLKPGSTVDQARAALPSLEKAYHAEFADKIDSLLTTSIVPLPEDVTRNLRPAFATLVAAVIFLLLIACSNVVNLLLVRFSGRRREVALRLALGASRVKVVQLFVLESCLISTLAGALGAALAWRLIPLVPKMARNVLPLGQDSGTGVSFTMLGFTVALSLLTGLAIGIYPACQSLGGDLVNALKEGGRGVSGSLRQQRFRRILVAVQVALSVTLLSGAALLVLSFVRLSRQDIGFLSDNLWVGRITLPQSRYPDLGTRQRFVEQALSALRAIPGFENITASGDIPLTDGPIVLYARADKDILPADQRDAAPAHNIASGYFRTWGIPILSGRDFDEHDLKGGHNVILISAAGARKVFGSENPIGHSLLITSASTPTEIIGVVGDVRSKRLTTPNDMEFYRPWSQDNFPSVNIAIRSKLQPELVSKLVKSVLDRIDLRLAIDRSGPMKEIVGEAVGPTRLLMILLGIFACFALLLATVGIFGAVAYTVEQRTGEIGVRMALGAQTLDIVRLVVFQGMKPVLAGLVAGLAAVVAFGRLLASQLYQVSVYDPLLLVSTAIVLAAAGLIACLLPTRRASIVDPIQALRME